MLHFSWLAIFIFIVFRSCPDLLLPQTSIAQQTAASKGGQNGAARTCPSL
jgi:hypothetical protein